MSVAIVSISLEYMMCQKDEMNCKEANWIAPIYNFGLFYKMATKLPRTTWCQKVEENSNHIFLKKLKISSDSYLV